MNNEELKIIAENLISVTEIAGNKSIELYKKGLKKIIKPDNSPVTNGDLEVNKILTEKIKSVTPNIPIISEETVDLTKKNKFNTFWLIDPIDGTKEYIAGKDEYTINAALVLNNNPTIGLLGAPKKKRLFYAYGKNNSYMIENNKTIKLDCEKRTPKGKIIAVSGSRKPSENILMYLKNNIDSLHQCTVLINFVSSLQVSLIFMLQAKSIRMGLCCWSCGSREVREQL